MSFPLRGSSVGCTGEMEGFLASLGGTDTSLSSDYFAMLAQQSVLEASGHNIGEVSQGEVIVSMSG